MRLVYDEKTLERLFSVERMRAVGVRETTIGRLGLPWAPPQPAIQRGDRWRGPR
jgi:hypothetical protein